MCSHEGGYSPGFYSEKTHKAKKDYRCCECFASIKTGDVYGSYAGKWDDFQWYRRCLACFEIAKQMDLVHCSWTFTQLLEDAQYALESDEHKETDPIAFQKLQDLMEVNTDESSTSESL